ncbi:phenylalanine--tRNA ligase subunit alpha [Candidatus Roizmanbacteria bacterium]|jgi:phenylalanyl-tRNA synthetase alpha chain|nr:phenylalanine--tRNA ligase subunit alpha [Candidatus Roizmanbacteria bacterium]
MDEAIKKLHHDFIDQLSHIKSLSQIESIRIDYLGRQGKINGLFKKINEVPVNQRKIYGQNLNVLKKDVSRLIEDKLKELAESEEKERYVDTTLPGKKYQKGSLHPLTLAIEEVSSIFEKIGFIRVSYPEVEWEHFSFEALNMPKGHPARDDFETFFIDQAEDDKYGKVVLSPHTSSGQTREMHRVKTPPIKMINIAKCYRPNWDVSHAPMFFQFEGLCIDKGINITHLKGTIDYFVKEFYGQERQSRLRPFHFQFTEPSFEVDISCSLCHGKGEIKKQKCRMCKSGWLELGGAGMVHPNVLKAGGIDHQEYTGWAFGWGVERVFMMKENLNIEDMRILYSGDIRFLEQF